MPEIVIKLPEDFERFSKVDTTLLSIAFQRLIRERFLVFKHLNKIVEKSELTEEDVRFLTKVVNKGLSEKHSKE